MVELSDLPDVFAQSGGDPGFVIKSPRNPVAFRVLAYTLGILCTVFAGVHIAWAAGWRTGLPVDADLLAQRPLFLAYEVGAAGLMLAAAATCVVICRVELSDRWHRRVTLSVLVGSELALLRGVSNLIFDVSALATEVPVQLAGVLADLTFVVIGISGLLIWRVMVGEGRALAYR